MQKLTSKRLLNAELNYKGNPKVNSDISSSGEINKIDD